MLRQNQDETLKKKGNGIERSVGRNGEAKGHGNKSHILCLPTTKRLFDVTNDRNENATGSKR